MQLKIFEEKEGVIQDREGVRGYVSDRDFPRKEKLT